MSVKLASRQAHTYRIANYTWAVTLILATMLCKQNQMELIVVTSAKCLDVSDLPQSKWTRPYVSRRIRCGVKKLVCSEVPF